MNFIELHYGGSPKLFVVDKISCIVKYNNITKVWVNGDPEEYYVEEPYEQIKSKLQEVGFIWNA